MKMRDSEDQWINQEAPELNDRRSEYQLTIRLWTYDCIPYPWLGNDQLRIGGINL